MKKTEFFIKVKNTAKSTGKALWTFVKRNYLMCCYIIAAILIELTAVAVTAGKFYMTNPWIFLMMVAFCSLISQYLPGHKSRYALFVTVLAFHIILDLVFIVVFDSTNGTIFDYAMLNLRGDAMRTLEVLPLSFTYIFVSGLLFALYTAIGFIYTRKIDKPPVTRASVAVTSALLSTVFMTTVFVTHYNNYRYDSNDLSYKLYQDESGTYSNKGIVGNFYNELVRGLWFSDIDVGDKNELHDFIYRGTTEPTAVTGVAAGYNVVTILCESFEWFTFLYDEERYPNGYAKPVLGGDPTANAEQIKQHLRELFPNMYRIYESQSTVILNNAHALEKTDITENKVILGNYPLYEYINYAYPNNTMPYSMPNMFKELFGVESNAFHNGHKTFYNRNEHHTTALGFNSFTSAEDIYTEDDGISSDDVGVGEHNLDSVMFDNCKEDMFPTDRRFYSHIVTITQHGPFSYRENLQEYYDKMDEYGILPLTEGDEQANSLRHYCAAGMDTDKALGIMLDYLDEKGLSDNTLITMFGDHNAYYYGMTNYVKNIYTLESANYTELYRVPVMIKVGNHDMGNTVIEKFTCVTDIYPTILDLLGVTGFSNLMYGTSVFNPDSTSILYSRAYDKFLTDKVYFNTLSSVAYKAQSVTDEYMEDIETRARALLNKISHTNRIYAGDYFKGENTDEFYQKLREINGELLVNQPAAKNKLAA